MTAALSAIDALLHRYERFGIDLGLESTLQLLAVLDNPHHGIPIVHVAGTNGKGSVCAYVSSVLAAGYRVGRYTSPHLVDWTERIAINHEAISAMELHQILMEIERMLVGSGVRPTQFEVITAAAWCYFAGAGVDVVVLEVGLGGRLDATNVCAESLVSVITSISLDHCALLGNSLAEIAYEKAGILKSGCPAVVGPLPLEAERVVAERGQALGCPVTWAQMPVAVAGPPHTYDQLSWVRVGEVTYPLPMVGEVQWVNSGVAIATLQTLRTQGWQISDTAIIEGMARTTWPGRLQWVDWQGRKLLLDGAHNPAAAHALRAYVDQLGASSVHWVVGMLGTKEHRQILSELLRPGDTLALVPIAGAKSEDPELLKGIAQEICPSLQDCQTFPTLIAGLESMPIDGQPVLAGSLYLVGDFLRNYAR